MDTIKYILILFFAVDFILLVGFLNHLGIFKKVEVIEKEVGPFEFIYKDYVGDYSKSGPIFDEVYKTLIINNINTTKGLGLYYDNPQTTPKEKCRAKVGVVLKEEDYQKFESIKDQYGRMTVEKTKAITTEFPYKNKMSFFIGVIKAYPTLMKYAQEKGYNTPVAIELYESDKIIYMMEIK